MKKLLLLFLFALLITACEEATEIDDIIVDNDEIVDGDESGDDENVDGDNENVDETDGADEQLDSDSTAMIGIYLADLSATTYPEEDTWVILDETASTEDFAGFSAAIEYISTNDSLRLISVEFPNLGAIPEYAIFGESSSSTSFASEALYSVSAEKATSIGYRAFYSCTSLTTVDMPLVTTLGTSAFSGCTALTTVDMPLVTSIDGSAFASCYSLTTVDMPLVTTIGHYAFAGCNALTTVNMPLVTFIGESVFRSCFALTTVDMPLVTTLETYAFCNCTDLTTIDMPLVTTIGTSAFQCCDVLTTVDMPLVTSIGDYAFYFCYYSLTTVDMPLVTSIGCGTFGSCKALTTLKLATEDGVVLSSIDSDAFYGVTTTDIDLTVGAANASLVSGSVLTVDGVSFEFKSITVDGTISGVYLADLSATTYPEEDTWVILDETATGAAFAGMSAAMEYISTIDTERRISIEFPNLEAIPDYAIFGTDELPSSVSWCITLCSVSAPKATTVGSFAFSLCTSLEIVDMPLVTTIGTWAFNLCNTLTTVDMPSVTTVGSSAFSGCSDLTTIDMPLVTSIGTGAFANCALTTINVDSDYYTFENGILYDAQKSTVIHVFSQAIIDGALSLPESVTSIGWNAFGSIYNLTTVYMPSVTTIGNLAFATCLDLTTIELATGDGVVLSSIDSSAFELVTTTDIDLTVGTANASLVSGSTLTVDGVSFEFKSITVL